MCLSLLWCDATCSDVLSLHSVCSSQSWCHCTVCAHLYRDLKWRVGMWRDQGCIGNVIFVFNPVLSGSFLCVYVGASRLSPAYISLSFPFHLSSLPHFFHPSHRVRVPDFTNIQAVIMAISIDSSFSLPPIGRVLSLSKYVNKPEKNVNISENTQYTIKKIFNEWFQNPREDRVYRSHGQMWGRSWAQKKLQNIEMARAVPHPSIYFPRNSKISH